MKNSILAIPLFLAAMSSLSAAEKIKVLILDGQNNHQWETTTPLLKEILDNAAIFEVEVSTSPPGEPKAPKLKKDASPEDQAAHAELVKEAAAKAVLHKATAKDLWAKWKPKFSDYAVVVSNYNGDDWPQDVNESLISYVKGGGGFVSFHAANNAFGKWKDYNQMVGLGGWGGRNASSGPYLRLIDGKWTKVEEPGACGGHGPQHEFLIDVYTPEHPINQGLPAKWMHTKDELYHDLRGPAENLTVLGGAMSDVKNTDQPLLMAIDFGKGRVFHTALGHYVEALDGLGFQITFARGTEWAATGKVTQAAPKAGELTAGPSAATRPLKKKP